MDGSLDGAQHNPGTKHQLVAGSESSPGFHFIASRLPCYCEAVTEPPMDGSLDGAQRNPGTKHSTCR